MKFASDSPQFSYVELTLFYMESAFCDRINGTYFYRDQ
ncbi:hypothetical protein LEP1GSC072_2575 [Leptospira noguchii str. Bonito]|nr:hypothetical protein LEP1GSC072_2575 [Leptospira noguchii str. Bonito]